MEEVSRGAKCRIRFIGATPNPIVHLEVFIIKEDFECDTLLLKPKNYMGGGSGHVKSEPELYKMPTLLDEQVFHLKRIAVFQLVGAG